MVSLQSKNNAKDINDIHDIFYVRIKIEPYSISGPAQCFSYQRFGHSFIQCGHALRCVKCGGEHTRKSCVKSKEVVPKCCNCNWDHTENYRGCLKYIEIHSHITFNTKTRYMKRFQETYCQTSNYCTSNYNACKIIFRYSQIHTPPT